MRQPRRVFINGKKYKVIPLTWGKHYGEYCKDEGYIAINQKESKREKAATLIHEVLHGIIAEYKLFVRKEEQLVRGLEEGIIDFIVNNPKAVKYILRHIGKDDTKL